MAKTLRLVLKRVLSSISVFLIVSIIIFIGAELAPGDTASRMLGREATPEAVQALRERLGLDRSPVERYMEWLSGVVRGDFGTATSSGRPVNEIVAPRLGNTLILAAVAFALYVPVTLSASIISAVYHGRTVDHVIALLTLLGLSVPEFVVGTSLLLLFAVAIPLFPAVSMVDTARSFADYVRLLALPTLVLTIAMSVYAIRMLRDNLIDVLDSNYVKMATLKGLERRRIILKHALPNALLPVLNVTALNLTYLIGGVVIVEVVFTYPGLGTLMMESLSMRDAPLIEATVLIPSAVYILANLIADVSAVLLTPRLRTA
jgi:peptide/nickel transport system permease protein